MSRRSNGVMTLPIHNASSILNIAQNGEVPTYATSYPLMAMAGALSGAIGGAFLMWQVGWSQRATNIGDQAGRGAMFGAGMGAIGGLLLAATYNARQV